jgi:16S rRNA (cytidine1402-2'-O)-methyltransferase
VPLAVCATPIGNLEDVSLRVLAELREADVVLCEDTRRTALLLGRYDIRAKALRSNHLHNEERRVGELLPRLVAGERIAIVSDAGLPGVNDPGTLLVRAAIAAGVLVTVLPGASAVETALVVSGLAGAQYRFLGYFPRRERELVELWAELDSWSHPIVAFESPKRLPATLASLARVDPLRPVAVCRELTKLHEEVIRGSVAEIATRFSEPPRGEVTVVIGASESTASTLASAEAHDAVARLVESGATRRTAAEVVSSLTGVPRKKLYDSSLGCLD